jgi:starch phosphorylase
MELMGTGYFCTEGPRRFAPIIESLTTGGDRYLVLADYADFVACQERVDSVYGEPVEWARKTILNVANMGKFSSDSTIAEYARRVWNVTPVAHE